VTVNYCLEKVSRDNVSVVVVVFEAAFRRVLPVHNSVAHVLTWTGEQ
jgi:hypothetical protein